MLASFQETIDVGRAKGIKLPPDALDKVLGFVGHAPPAMKASMANDLDRGNRLELDWLAGRVSPIWGKISTCRRRRTVCSMRC